MATRANVISQARKYLSTPFIHQGRVMGVGVDCVGLVLCVADDLGLNDIHGLPLGRHDYPDYDRQPDNHTVQAKCIDRLVRVLNTAVVPGDIVNVKMPDSPCHTGIVTAVNADGSLTLIHAYNTGRPDACVVEHRLDHAWRRRIAASFRFPEVVS